MVTAAEEMFVSNAWIFYFSDPVTKLSIFFLDNNVETFKRIETLTLTDFMSACGGLLGLFLGVSVLSIIEFIYFFTLRLFWRIRRSYAETNGRRQFHVAPSKVNTTSVGLYNYYLP